MNMRTTFLQEGVWPAITATIGKYRRPCLAAVAYAGLDAPKLLPLRRGSTLVVDASIAAMKSGLTHPDALRAFLERGIRIYSQQDLHAKVFVIGSKAVIGSTNASRSSAQRLIEAAVITSEASAVEDAQRFIRSLCLHQLMPTEVERLATHYRPPRVPSADSPSHTKGRQKQSRQTVYVAQLERIAYPREEKNQYTEGLEEARRRANNQSGYVVDSFRLTGGCHIERGHTVIQVLTEKNGTMRVSPPARILHKTRRQTRNGVVTYVYVEREALRRMDAARLAKRLGGGDAVDKLGRNGVVRERRFAEALLTAWHRA